MVNNSRCGEDGTTLPGQEVWWVYIATYAVLYFFFLGMSCISFGIYYMCKKCKRQSSSKETPLALKKIREFVRKLISGDTIASKFFIIVTFVCNFIYMVLAVYRAYSPYQVEYCFTLSQDPARIAELVVVIELIAFALLRFLASNNIVWYWFSPYTIVDVITLPHIFVSIVLGVDWLGLRSARFLWLTQLITVIRSSPYIFSQDLIDFASLLIYFAVLLLIGTGIVHLLEFSGDPWLNFSNAVTDSPFLTYAYYIIITITTVGYGDISPTTAFGRAFMVVYLIIGLAFFAALLPIISDVITNFNAKRQYAKFDTTRVPRHVIVCGHITAFTAQEFLKDFLHPDRGDNHTHILFLHPVRPDRELKNVLRSYYTRVQYIVGSVLNGSDLQKCKVSSCSAVFILADKYTNAPLEEDNGNLLRLVSVKNTTTEARVIIQLLLGRSKKQVKNIGGWNVGKDIAVCLNELKLGLLAQSCVCPGFSTLIANLFYTSDFPVFASFEGANAWKRSYFNGASNEIYTSHFSQTFEGKTFQEAAHICFNKIGLILLAFESDDGKVYINPSSQRGIVVQSGVNGTKGYFIGQDSGHVSIVGTYCENCDGEMRVTMHNVERDIEKFVHTVTKRKCNCFTDLNQVYTNIDVVDNHSFRKHSVMFDSTMDDNLKEFEEMDEQYSFYIEDPKKIEDLVLKSDYNVMNTERVSLEDHIVLCIFADDDSPLLGLHNFLYPLRNKNIPRESMKPVVIVSNGTFLKREWLFIQKMPDVHVVDGSPLRIQNLEAASIKSCSVCIITTIVSAKSDELPINDKEVVLCSLSIQNYLKRNATHEVQIITDLRQESNVQFLDFDDEDEPDERIYKAQPFACGEAFSVSMMDSVTSSAFHSPGTLHLIEYLIHASGGKGSSIQIQAFPLDSHEYAGKTFRDFFNLQLQDGNLVLGLYRQLQPSRELEAAAEEYSRGRLTSRASVISISMRVSQVKHYVVTAPHPMTRLELSDIAFVLVSNPEASGHVTVSNQTK